MSDDLTKEMALALANFRKKLDQSKKNHSTENRNQDLIKLDKNNSNSKAVAKNKPNIEPELPITQSYEYINESGVKYQNLNFQKKLVNSDYGTNNPTVDCSQKIGLHLIIQKAVCNQFTLQSLAKVISKNDLSYVIDSFVYIINSTLLDNKPPHQFTEQFNLSNNFKGLDSNRLNEIFNPQCLETIFQTYLKSVLNFYGESLPPVMLQLFLKMVEYNRKPIRGFELELPIIYVQSLIQTWLKERVYVIMTRTINPITIKIFKQIIEECNIPLSQARLHVITSKSFTLSEVLLLEQSGIQYIIKVRHNHYLEQFLPYKDCTSLPEETKKIDDCTCFRTVNINLMEYIEQDQELNYNLQADGFSSSIDYYNYSVTNPHANDRFKFITNNNYDEFINQNLSENGDDKNDDVEESKLDLVPNNSSNQKIDYNYHIGYACVMETEYYPKGYKSRLIKTLSKLNAQKKVTINKSISDLICVDPNNSGQYKLTDRGIIVANPAMYATQYIISHSTEALNTNAIYLYNQSNILKVLYNYARRDLVLSFVEKNTLKHDVLVLLASALTEIYNFVDISLREPTKNNRVNEFRRKNLFKLDYIKIFQKFNNQYLYFFNGNTCIDINSKSSLIYEWYDIDLPSRIAEIYSTQGFLSIQKDIKAKHPQININYDPSLAIIFTKEE